MCVAPLAMRSNLPQKVCVFHIVGNFRFSCKIITSSDLELKGCLCLPACPLEMPTTGQHHVAGRTNATYQSFQCHGVGYETAAIRFEETKLTHNGERAYFSIRLRLTLKIPPPNGGFAWCFWWLLQINTGFGAVENCTTTTTTSSACAEE